MFKVREIVKDRAAKKFCKVEMVNEASQITVRRITAFIETGLHIRLYSSSEDKSFAWT